MRLLSLLLMLFPILCYSQAGGMDDKYEQIKTADSRATKQTKALFKNLHLIKEKGVLFGHQDDLAYGVHWKAEKTRSDIRDVCGAFPAVYGWEIAWIGNSSHNLDTVDFKKMKKWIRQGYRRGGVITIGWHMNNPKTGSSAWDKTGAIKDILPGGPKHFFYKQRLDVAAGFFSSLKSSWLFGHPIPIIFRPFHEHTGDWFWWGRPNNTPEDYIALWRFTVEYLRDIKGLHNLLYAYSPDIFESKGHYLECYPGDEWVDILGLDDYHDVSSSERISNLTKRLKTVVEIAEEKGKIAALTETGYERIPQDDWWTEMLLKHIKNDPIASRIAYLLVWRNARETHHYAPYKGHGSSRDFIKFYQDEFTIFENDLPQMYRLN